VFVGWVFLSEIENWLLGSIYDWRFTGSGFGGKVQNQRTNVTENCG
jgi:hypothetical protein